MDKINFCFKITFFWHVMPSCPADKWKLSEEREREEVDHLETLPTVYQKHSVISQNPITLIFTAVGFLAVFKF